MQHVELQREDVDVREAILGVEIPVDAPVDAVRDWFLSLEEHPERYAFDTHAGFEFEHGSFGEPGARFSTREKFYFVTLRLLFELTDVRQRAFTFLLLRPAFLEIWGRFEVEELPGGRSSVALRVGSETRVGQLLLRFYPVAAGIHRQVCGELRNIRDSIEKTSASA